MKISFFLFLLLSTLVTIASENKWDIVLAPSIQNDEAIKVAVNDLKENGASFHIGFHISTDVKNIHTNTILVGSPETNEMMRSLVKKNQLQFKGITDSQGYEIKTLKINGNKIICVTGGSVLGETYGLYWILDRLKVFGEIPEINTVRTPKVKIRFGNGNSKEQIRSALRYGATWVWGGYSVNKLVPWDAEPERTENEKNRKETKELIDYAHSLHLKFFVYEDEFSYHQSLLDEFLATLNPEDPALWKAVQAKYRRLLTALPDVDGIRLRTGEATRVGGNYKAFDVMHDSNSDWSLAKRYRTFVKKIYDVVVGEFDKIYYQRTWVTSAYEQHSMAAVYKEIFTNEIPVRNLYMSPYLSTTDRYFFQPYNPTFNITPHNMILLLSPLNYHGNNACNILPTFPGTYYQGGLKSILSVDNSTCKGFDFGTLEKNNWDTWTLTAYTVYRLSWEPDMDVKTIAKDFASMYFGRKISEEIAELLMLSPKVYKYGMYIEPAAHGQFASLTHLRLTTFPVKGLPRLDNGKKHMEFLYDIFARCRPWIEETYLYLDHGLQLAEKLKTLCQKVSGELNDETKKDLISMNTDLTYKLVKANNLYVKTFISYFSFCENDTPENKKVLENYSNQLSKSMQDLLTTPGNRYQLDGMSQLQVNVKQALEDLPHAKKILANAPNDEEIKEIITDQQKKYAQVLEKYKNEAQKIVYWQGRVDGRDLFKVKGDTIEIEHLRFDNIVETSHEFFHSLPAKEFTIIPVDIHSRSFHPFILEQPSAKNDYTVTVYLSDFPMHGYSWWKFELYYIPHSPKELGLEVPWNN